MDASGDGEFDASPAPGVGARRATTADTLRLAELAAEANRATAAIERGGAVWARADARRATPSGIAELIDLVAADGAAVLVGTIDGEVMGYAVASVAPLTDHGVLVRISDLYVEDAARAVGVGRAMLDAVVAWADELGAIGVDAWALPGERETKNFFEAAGFTARLLVVHHRLRSA